jgi:uncharacterized protein (TIGR03437 family)
MRPSAVIRPLFALAAAACLLGQPDPIEVGSQSPNAFIYQRFLGAYNRNGFNTLVSLPPATHVQKFGGTGLIQLYFDALQTQGVRLALVKADANAGLSLDALGQVNGGDVYQVTTPLFTYLASVNSVSTTAPSNFNVTGFPKGDTQSGQCGTAVCYYQFFDKNYALFSILTSGDGTPGGDFTVKGKFYTQWTTGGDLSGFGAPLTNEAQITSSLTQTKATWQQFVSGYLFLMNEGTVTERFIPVNSPVAEYYKELGGPTGNLGLPVEVLKSTADGKFRQSFEGGTVEYKTGERPALLLPVRQVFIDGLTTSGVVKLRRGESIDVRARLVDAFSAELTGRVVSWITSNGRIVSIEASGATAKLRAVGAGLATVTAVSEGMRSAPLSISVSTQCCEAGEGAPNPTVSQAVQEAIRRNRLTVRIPTGAPVQRMGAGHYQEFQDASTGLPYLVAVPDPGSTGYVVKGEILGRLSALGGLTGLLGYPSSDETAGGRQMFSGRYALAGRPVRVVQAPLLDRWAKAGYETGALGSPLADVSQAMSFTGAPGIFQRFANGLLAASNADLRTYAVAPPLLARYLALDGPVGDLGLPAAEEVTVDGVRRQLFEGGSLTQPEGAEVAVHLEPRKPALLITPNPVTAGSRLRIAAGGFPSGTQLRITAGSDPGFDATAANGAFAWETAVPPAATAATVRVVAESPDGLRAEGSYRIRSVAEAEPKLTKVAGDLQTGPPGALLPLALQVVLRDGQGAPLTGVPVSFQPAPGTILERAETITDSAGEARAWMRLPEAEGVALATATAARQVVTFSARGANTILPTFPAMSQDLSQPLGTSSATIREEGALLAASANVIRFYQDRGLLPSPNGLADPLSLNLFLKDYCAFTTPGGTPQCDGFFPLASGEHAGVNLARVPAFAGGVAVFEFGEPRMETIRDWLAEGDPVLLALKMDSGSLPAGMHYIVARGIAANGGVLAFDPSPLFGRSSLNDFLTDFNAGGRVWRGTLVSAARLRLRPPGPNFFYVRSSAPFKAHASQGACSSTQEWYDRPAALTSVRQPLPWYFALCDSQSESHQINVEAQGAFTLEAASGASNPGARAVQGQGQAAFRVHTGSPWTLSTQTVELDRDIAPVNAANLLPQLGPGSLMSVFGSGLLAADGHVSIEVAGFPLAPAAKSPFRLTAWLPPGLAPGRHPARIENSLGQVQFEVDVLEAAPAIFQDEKGRPLVTHPDGRAVTAADPAVRGAEIHAYATGLGELDGLQARSPVSAQIDGRPAEVAAVEWVAEQAGVYRVRIRIPQTQAPGVSLSLTLKQAEVTSPPVTISIR